MFTPQDEQDKVSYRLENRAAHSPQHSCSVPPGYRESP